MCNIVKNWLKDHPEIEELPWPPKGCDMNPIENAWADMVYELNAQGLKKKDQLWDEIESLWERLAIRSSYWNNLSQSMNDRLQMVVDADGGWTKY